MNDTKYYTDGFTVYRKEMLPRPEATALPVYISIENDAEIRGSVGLELRPCLNDGTLVEDLKVFQVTLETKVLIAAASPGHAESLAERVKEPYLDLAAGDVERIIEMGNLDESFTAQSAVQFGDGTVPLCDMLSP